MNLPDAFRTGPAVDEDVKIIWIVGMGRAGSMWTYNVTRDMLRTCGLGVLPEHMPQTNRGKFSEARVALANQETDMRWIMKIHRSVSERFPRSRFLSTRRDPRDILVSQMRFAAVEFEKALEAAVHYTRMADHFRAFSDRLRLELEYTDIVGEPGGVCGRIANFLGLDPPIVAVDAIVETYSKQRVRALIDDLADRERAERASVSKTVQRVDRNKRLYDLSTGFQSGHVSDYRDGDWRRLLSPAERNRMHAALNPWLAANGYEPG